MKRSERIEVVNNALKNKELCRVGYRYNDYLKYMFPLLTSEKLFLASRESDFSFGGYHIGKFSDICTVDSRKSGDKLYDIIKAEGISKYFNVPDVDVTDWKSVFESLQKCDGYIIVKCEWDYDTEYCFIMGKIIKVTSRKVVMKNFTSDGEWEEELYHIPFGKITTVEFGCSYCNVFSKYI
ncbi:MAG: hypothetical protein IKJ17_04565 [Clostridia bacterium]|nr:hypothetical protein [Clostridia bacterium]